MPTEPEPSSSLGTVSPQDAASSQGASSGDSTVQGLPASNPKAPDCEILDLQIHLPEAKASFLSLYRHASPLDFITVIISTVAALLTGALYPIAPVSSQPWNGISP